MKYQSHLVIAAAAVTLTQPWHQPSLPMVAIYAMGLLGGLLPDIDHPKSFIGSKVPLLPTLLFRYGGGHRGVTHSLLALSLLTAAGFFLAAVLGFQDNAAVCWSLGLGYASHLGADLITNRGIPALWPLRQRYRVPITVTGSRMEAVIVLAVFYGTAFWTIRPLVPWGTVQQQVALLLGYA